ncbi:MAG: SBBP repeat-containing protein, partial [Actinomycetota bacterium]|nr:SBBP repeat-containing protein [Actinomycetota bacterium]
MALGPGGATLGLGGGSQVGLRPLGANPFPQLVGTKRLGGLTNHVVGNDASRWTTGVVGYAGVDYHGVYPGIDVSFSADRSGLTYDFALAAGTDAATIAVAVDGAAGLRLGPGGDLVMATPGGDLHQPRPTIYARTGDHRRTVTGGYRLLGDNRLGFWVGPHDPAAAVVIDPVVQSSAYVGGNGADAAQAVATDAAGNLYVTGTTASPDLPTTAGALQATKAGGTDTCIVGAGPLAQQGSTTNACDAFVAKYDPTGAPVWTTYLGGAGVDFGRAIAVDAAGDAYVAGSTSSTDFPVTPGAFQVTNRGGNATLGGPRGGNEAFVAKLDPAGAYLSYATYLGGTGADQVQGIAIDSTGAAYVTGFTTSSDFPIAGTPYQSASKGGGVSFVAGNEAFVTKLDPQGASLVYSTYLGGTAEDAGQAIAVDSDGDAYVTGLTFSTDFPVVRQFSATGHGPPGDVFVTELTVDGSNLVYSTYLGGKATTTSFQSLQVGTGIAVGEPGQAVVTGSTSSAGFPVTTGLIDASCGADNNGAVCAFITELDTGGPGGESSLVYSTFLGGHSGKETVASGIAIDAAGRLFVTGSTLAGDFPTTADADQAHCGTGSADACNKTGTSAHPDAFVAVVDPSVSGDGSGKPSAGNRGLVYSSYLGGGGDDAGLGIALRHGAPGLAAVVGVTRSTDLPGATPT